MVTKRKPLSLGERLERSIQEHNRRTEENRRLYQKMCKIQGVKVGEPVDIMTLIKKRK